MDQNPGPQTSPPRDGRTLSFPKPAAQAAAAPEESERSDDKPEAPAKAAPNPRRRLIVIAVAGAVALAALLYYLHSRHFEDTDDAQIDANISNLGARVAGTITRVDVAENQVVAVGAVLAEIDPTELEVALAQARASVAQAEAQLAAEDPTVSITETSNTAALSTASSNVVSASAGLSASERDVEQATARLAEAVANDKNAQLERARGENLFAHGAIPRADLDRRKTAAEGAAAVTEGARQSLRAAQARVTQQQAVVAGVRSHVTEVRQNAPREVVTRKAAVLFRQANLELARAQQRQAELNLGYAKVRSPVAGIVDRKAVSLGDHVTPGQQLVAITQIGDVWVTANFRETQLRRMRPGQTASIHVDAIDQSFSGVVESVGGATGSRVSVLPPENASGNYVKVVQRLPVRIRLDGGQANLERLRPGMSVEPRVRVAP
jgi:membrane fusion protein (multidrug efflux system)